MSATWFEQQKRSFADVKIDAANDNGISTTEFLEAAESLTTLFGMPLAMIVDNEGDSADNIYPRCSRLQGFHPCEE